jgi:fatty-acid peroxygenase
MALRCAAIALLGALAVRLARLDYAVPAQDLPISVRRVPAMPASRMTIGLAEGQAL